MPFVELCWDPKIKVEFVRFTFQTKKKALDNLQNYFLENYEFFTSVSDKTQRVLWITSMALFDLTKMNKNTIFKRT